MECTPEQRNFVAQHVAVFSKRHWAKLNQVTQPKSVETIIQESNNAEMIEATAYIDALEADLILCRDKFNQACCEFSGAFGETLADLVANDNEARKAFLTENQEKFDYKIRRAIGLVELVSSEKAYELLDRCREQIRNLGKENDPK